MPFESGIYDFIIIRILSYLDVIKCTYILDRYVGTMSGLCNAHNFFPLSARERDEMEYLASRYSIRD